MFDPRLRPLKDRALDPIAVLLARRVSPITVTAIAFGSGLGAAVAAAGGLVGWSLAAWWTSRLADGLDGLVARVRGSAGDLGGFADLVGDAIVYIAVPLGVAAAVDDRSTWIAVAVLLASFYVNAVSWLYLSAVLAKRGGDSARAGSTTSITSITMPSGLVEGAETIVLYSLFLAFPSHAALWFSIMAALVAVTIVQRAAWTVRTLR